MAIEVFLASRNSHKCHEIEALGRTMSQDSPLTGLWIRPCTDLDPQLRWDETGTSYLENARIKAHVIRQHMRERGRVIADDSGLEVAALGGAPGVYTSSFGGIEGDHARNISTLLTKLKGYPPAERRAAFVCLILYYDLSGREWVFTGRLEGRIAEAPDGQGGFGYDPIFVPEGLGKTLAQLSDGEKNAISHRGRAVTLWKEHLEREIRSIDLRRG